MSNAQFSFPFPTILNNIAEPVEGIDAANKDYVDAAIADLTSGNIDLTNYVEKTGDTMSGNLIVEDVSGTVDYRIELAPQSLTITSSEDSKIETTEIGLGLIDMYSVASPADLTRTTVQAGEIVLQDQAGDPAIPTSDDQVTTKKYVDDLVDNIVSGDIDLVKYVEKAGDTMTGPLQHTGTSGTTTRTSNLTDSGLTQVIAVGGANLLVASYSALGADLDGPTGNTDIRPGSIGILNSFGAPAMPEVNEHVTTKKYVDDTIASEIDTALTDVVLSVNGILPVDNNINISLVGTSTGPLDERPLRMANPEDGSVYIVSGDPDPANDGLVYIFSSTTGVWIEISPPGLASSDARYVLKSGDTMSGALQHTSTSGSTTFTTALSFGGLSHSILIGGANRVSTFSALGIDLDDGTTGNTDIRPGSIAIITSSGDPAMPGTDSEVTTKKYVDDLVNDQIADLVSGNIDLTNYVAKAGDTMTGALNIDVAPTPASNNAATTNYVDDASDLKVDKAGDTMSGNLDMAVSAVNFGTGPNVASVKTSGLSVSKTQSGFDYSTETNSQGISVSAQQSTGAGLTDLLDMDVSGIVLDKEITSNSKIDIGKAYPGQIVLLADKGTGEASMPTLDEQVATKKYVDTKLSLTGGTLTGDLVLSGDPTDDLQAATKQYVDDAIADSNAGNLEDYVLKAGDSMTGALQHTFTTGATTFTSNLYYGGLSHTISIGGANRVSSFGALGIDLDDAITGNTDIRPGSIAIVTASGDPVMPGTDSEVTTKKYVDDAIAGASNLSGNIAVGGGAPSTSTTTGALRVNGGLGVTGNVHIGGIANISSIGNLKIGGGTPAQFVTTDGTGNLSFASVSAVGTSGTLSAAGSVQFNYGGNFTGDDTFKWERNDGLLSIGTAAPTAPGHATNKAYVDGVVDNKLPLAGGTMTGTLTLSGDPTGPLDAATKDYVDTVSDDKLSLTGGSMTGNITMAPTGSGFIVASQAPTLGGHLTNKTYVDTKISLSGGIMSGALQHGTVVGPTTRSSSLSDTGLTHSVATSGGETLVATYNGSGADLDGLTGNTNVRAGYIELKNTDGTPRDPASNAQVTTKKYVDDVVAAASADNTSAAVLKAGSTMTGKLTLDADPTSTLHAATKGYVDTGLATKLNTAGGTATGDLVMSSANVVAALSPTLGAHLTNKTYVDSEITNAVSASREDVVLTVNGIAPVNNNVSIAFAGTVTGPALPAGAPTPIGGQTDGIVFIISGAVDPTQDGTAYIWSDSSSTWLEISPAGQASSDARYVLNSGDTMTGDLTLNGAPTVNLHAATKGYVDTGLNAKLNTAGGTMSGNINMDGSRVLNMAPTPTSTGEATSKGYVDSRDDLKLNLAGGTMTGALTLSGAPTVALSAATKAYVDAGLDTKLSTAGGNMIGNIEYTGNIADVIFYRATLNDRGLALTQTTGPNTILTSLLPNGMLMSAPGSGNTSINAGNITLTNVDGSPKLPVSSTEVAVKAYVDNVGDTKLPLAGGTMTGNITLAATGNGFITASQAPTLGGHLTNKTYVDSRDDLKINLAGGTMTGPLVLSGAPTVALGAATKAYVDSAVTASGSLTNYVLKAGDTFSGNVTMSGTTFITANTAPTATGHLTNKAYVDSQDNLKLNLAGGTLTGLLTLSGAPTVALHAATKAYVDSAVTGGTGSYLPLSGGTMTGNVTLAPTGNGYIVANLAPTLGTHLTNKTYVDSRDDLKLNLAGGTMTGLLTLSGVPTSPLHSATKAYVDGISTNVDTKLSLTGGSMTGNITMAATGNGFITASQAPTVGGHLTNKTYVDSRDDLKLNLAGGTMSGLLTLSGAPTAPLQAATKAYVDSAITTGTGSYLPLAGGTLTGNITLAPTGSGYIVANLAPTLGTHLTNKTYVDNGLGTKLNTSGGTLSGALVLSGAPTAPLQAATKDYVDTAAAAKLNISGGTMSGLLTLSGAPTVALGAATKAYVDAVATNVDSKLPLAGGTMTGNINMNGSRVLNMAPTPTSTGEATSKNYVDTQDNLKINKSGDEMVGFLTLNAFPVNDRHAATKLYVDSAVSTKLDRSGGTMTGNITLAATGNGYIVANLAPTLGTHLTNKTYVDTKLSLTGGTLTGPLTLSGLPTVGTEAASKNYIDQQINLLPSSITALEYASVSFNADYSINAATANTTIVFSELNTFNGNILIGTGTFTLRANKTYHLRAALGGSGGSGYVYYAWKNASTNAQIGRGSIGGAVGMSTPRSDMVNSIAEVIFRDTIDTVVSLKTHAGGSGTVIAKPFNTSGFSSSWATIIQLR